VVLELPLNYEFMAIMADSGYDIYKGSIKLANPVDFVINISKEETTNDSQD
jgi:hypothetical protein